MTMLINPYIFSVTWGPYADLATAESSGDSWGNGDTIQITGGPNFVYFTALDVVGHSGLIHKDPFNESSALSSVNLLSSEAANTDPDSWTGWTDVSDGTKGVDYDFDINASRARVRLITTAPFNARLTDSDLTSGDTNNFLIIDDISSVISGPVSGNLANGPILRAYVNGTTSHNNLIRQKHDGIGNWWFSETGITHTDLGVNAGTPTRVWMYIKANKAAVWFAGAATPAIFTALIAGGQPQPSCVVRASGDGTTITGALQVGYFVHGNMSL